MPMRKRFAWMLAGVGGLVIVAAPAGTALPG